MEELPAFLTIKRQTSKYRPVKERLKDYKEVAIPREADLSQKQGSRCMNCGIPFCHWTCPVGNYVPNWNEYIGHGQWKEAYQMLSSANNLPEVTGRVCPATCEYACVLNLSNEEPVTIRENELAIVEYAFQAGYVEPVIPKKKTGKSVAVVGSGPAGLCCSAQLNQAGHKVVLFERDDKVGGVLRYGIPDFKLEKWIIDRRVEVWQKEGIEIITNTNVGVDYPTAKLLKEFDAICLSGGSRAPRNLDVPGRGLRGIHFAMDYLTQSNLRVAGKKIAPEDLIDAHGKNVVVIGGGDTGADCVGTANRQGAKQVVQIEIMAKPPEKRAKSDLWPDFPGTLRSSSSHEEGVAREWSVMTKEFLGEGNQLKKLHCIRLEWNKPNPKSPAVMKELSGSDFEIKADMVILAMGFMSPEHPGLLNELGVKFDPRGNVLSDAAFKTSIDKVFSAGDMRRGQSLVVWAIQEGRRAAHHIDKFLMGKTELPLI
jgi:glutamate synthase (NADPH) small chain